MRLLPRGDVAALALAYLPFFLNDIANIFVSDPVGWLAVDYGSRVAALACVFALVRQGRVTPEALGLKRPAWLPLLVWTVGLTALSMLIDQQGDRVFALLLPRLKLGGYPKIEGWLHWLDLGFGLALVSVSEELVSRGLFCAWLRDRLRPAAFYPVSMLLFGAAHWSLGTWSMLGAAAIGGLFMLCLRRTGSLWPALVAHYLVDLAAFF